MEACRRTGLAVGHRPSHLLPTDPWPATRSAQTAIGHQTPATAEPPRRGSRTAPGMWLCLALVVSVVSIGDAAAQPLTHPHHRDPQPAATDKQTVHRPEWADRLESYQNQGQFHGQIYLTRNFAVRAASPTLAQAVGDRAEGYRELLAQQWLGNTLPDWPQRCPIQVTISHQAEGETTFMLPTHGQGLPEDWDMKIFGPTDRLLDSVLPHEVTHTIFATHFRQRLPRWADEGACTTVEHPSERAKIQALLLRYLSPEQRQGIPFNRMFPMRDYPPEMLPLYAQGYSVARFLIAQGGHRRFVQLIEQGMRYEASLPVTTAWDRAMQEVYGYQDLSDLQLDWLQWVAEGSHDEAAVARSQQRTGIRMASAVDSRNPPTAARSSGSPPAPPARSPAFNDNADNYYVQQMMAGNAGSEQRVAAERIDSTAAHSPTSPRPLPLFTDAEPIANPESSGKLGPNFVPRSTSSFRSDSNILLPQRLR